MDRSHLWFYVFGKTEEFDTPIEEGKNCQPTVEIFKPKIDTRYDDKKVVSHDANFILSTPIEGSHQLLKLTDGVGVVGVDEAQFFDNDLPDVCQQLALRGIRVICAGLDMDYKGNPFGPMPNLLAVAEYITKVHAICQHCGNLATHSYRFSESGDTVVVGEKDRYEPRCRTCYHMGNILNLQPRQQNEKPADSKQLKL